MTDGHWIALVPDWPMDVIFGLYVTIGVAVIARILHQPSC